MTKLTAISLFSGAGGLDVGFEEAGFDILFANEFDSDAAQAWRLNRPGRENVMVEGDFRECIGKIDAFKGVDVVFGGPPCQGFSVAGKMDPKDERSKLVWLFLDAVSIVRPRAFVMENVAALGQLKKWEEVRKGILKRGEELGYHVFFKVHHTADYGVPENRDRVIFIGVKDGEKMEKAFYDALAAKRAAPKTAREVLISAGKYGSADNPQTCTSNVTLALHPVLRASPYAGMLVNGAGRPIDLDGICPTLPASMGGNKTPIVDEHALYNPSDENWFVTYHDELMRNGVEAVRISVPPSIRRLTLKESAAIQTFPEGYKFFGRKTKQYRQIGNAVPCRFARVVAQSLRSSVFE